MAEAEFSYGNTGLLFDQDRVAQRFLDRYLPFQDLVVPAGNPAHDDWQGNTYGQGRAGLPRPNYPPPPPPRINTLYWPTGAVRWARGWFLCDQAGMEALTDFNDPDSCWVDGYAVPKTLKVSTPSTKAPDPPDPYVLECEMYLLRPLRVTATDDEAFGDLWLLPLVDARYWWQFRDCGDMSSSLDSWGSLIGHLATRLGVTIAFPEVNCDYMYPDPVELARHYDNAAIVLDAVAHSIGRRVVVDYDGAVRLAKETTEKTTLADNRKELDTGDTKYMSLEAGNPDADAAPPAYPWPDEVRLVFQQAQIQSGAQEGEGTFWTASYSSDDAATELSVQDLVTAESTAKTLHCSAWAEYDTAYFSGDPENANKLRNLCERYALDFYGWLRYQYDHSWPGVQKWEPTGYDDHVLFELGTEYVDSIEAIANYLDTAIPDVMVRENLQRRYATRVQSMPANFGVTSLLCESTMDRCSTGSSSTGSTSTGSTSTGSTSTGSTSTGSTSTGSTSTGSSPSGSQSQSTSQSGSPSGSGSSVSGSLSQSDKSTAIVPASWSPTGYAALYILEAPDVRFTDVLTATVTESSTYVPLDHRYIDVCEPGSLWVTGCQADVPLAVGATIEAAGVRITLGKRKRKLPVSIVISLTGIRKGFANKRFGERTQEQFEANERFIKSAYPGVDR